MFCESHRQPLIDSLAAGKPLPPELAEHLASCSACTAVFAEERTLFASIDRLMYAAVNAEIPVSIVPGVREAILQKEFPVRHIQWRAIFAFGSAFVIVGTLLLWHSRPISRTERLPVVASLAAPPAQEKQIELPARVSRGVAPSAPNKNPVTRPIPTRSGLAATVIVLPQEEDGLKKYAVLVNANIGKNLANNATRWEIQADPNPLDIAEINISRLAIQPLESGEAD
jgi:hypothetical protein